MSSYFLVGHVSVCGTPDAAVLLDLKANRYHGLNRLQARALAAVVQGWPCPGGADLDERESVELAEYLEQLGLLTKDPARGKSAAPPQLPRIQERLSEWTAESWQLVRLADWWKFALAIIRAKSLLRFRSMEATVSKVLRRKAAAGRRSMDLERLREVTGIYRALRPFFYTQKRYCLFDSLVLIEFMALHELFPTWVIGVTATPFAAHSWVQEDHYVLTCAVHSVYGYTPILAI